MNPVLRARHRAVHHLVTWLSVRPGPYFTVRRLTGTMDALCVRHDTELVIEGFPRSANSTTVYGFLERQPEPIRVAHHKHHAAQLLRAAAWGLPAVLLVRPPRETILSLLALAEEGRRRSGGVGGRGSALTFRDVGRAWLAFNEACLPYLDAFVIAPFAEVTRDLAGTIDRINGRFGTTFSTAPAAETTAHQLGWHARPNPLRDEVKAQLQAAFAKALDQDPCLARLVRRCEAVHEQIVERRVRTR